ncbi:PEP-CTERM protein-sorting domain-containing protein [Parasphingorhabdus marina DSM 22363]|uniref:PEP-CTERM protein-sorting domain-containing protein n=1 Tax=Parasphingorhabdus marina DSM 22363 TaxID=1123272 RepID=A0A1N6D8K5_9SPHN|nr:PEP-CTERM sorting domain-containing protein [Parasphingorhabdus marina]SIN67119.1 PEP-CTERM protein-sorting domain-containing protein [Parasphingorhabdus marina DSM 22363]
MILSRLSVVATTACILVTVAAPLSAGQAAAQNVTKTDHAASAAPTAAPAAEQDGTPIPEPSNIIMLALGITGLVVGRYAAKRHRDGR